VTLQEKRAEKGAALGAKYEGNNHYYQQVLSRGLRSDWWEGMELELITEKGIGRED